MAFRNQPPCGASNTLAKAPGHTARLLIDVINGLNFQEADKLAVAVLRVGDDIRVLFTATDAHMRDYDVAAKWARENPESRSFFYHSIQP